MIVGERDGVSLVKDMGSEMLYRLQLTSMSLDKWTRKRHHSPGHKRRYWWCQDDVRETGIVSVSIVSAWWRRDQVGGPVASKLDCHRDKNLLLGDFYHSQLWWTLACCHRRTGGKIEDEGEECGNDDTLVADKGQLWKPRKNVKKSRRSLLIWVRSLSNLVRNSLNNCLRLNLNDVPLVLRLMKVDKIVRIGT